MIEHAETSSRDLAATLIATAANLAANAKTELSCRTVKTTLPLLHDRVASEARFFDLTMLECIAGVPDTRIIAEAIIFNSRRPAIIFPNKSFAGPIDHLVIALDEAEPRPARSAMQTRSFTGPSESRYYL